MEKDLADLATLIHEGESFVKHSIEGFNTVSHREKMSEQGVFSRVCSVATAKGHRLLLGIYELNLSGLAQEGGALLRPLLEIIEQLIYFSQEPRRVYEVVNHNLPTAGRIAKEIKGKFKDLRGYLNKSASHFNYTEESVLHMIDQAEIRTIPDPVHSKQVFRDNLINILIFQYLFLRVASDCLEVCGYRLADRYPQLLEWDKKVRKIFEPTMQPESKENG